MALRLAEDRLFAHRFGDSVPFRIGVEEELFLVDRDTHAVALGADRLLDAGRARLTDGRPSGALCEGVVGLATPVCRTADEAVAALRQMRGAVLAQDIGLLLGAGLHPATPFGEVRHRDGDDCEAVARDARGTARQGIFCTLDVHVGMPDSETAIAAFNGMRKWVPLLHALGAGSPFWHGRDSGLQSARVVRVHDLPRTGLPRAFDGWEDYCATMREVIRVADVPGVESLWWDVRPRPGLGTLEVRVLDSQSSLEDLRGLVALVHCLAYHEALTADPIRPAKEILDASTFHAIRDGLEARLEHGGAIQHVQAIARQALDLASGYAPALGCAGALDAMERLLADGNSAARQRRAFASGGIEAVLALLVRETTALDPHREPRRGGVAAA